jgi:RND family efflux transporter MFP subunit
MKECKKLWSGLEPQKKFSSLTTICLLTFLALMAAGCKSDYPAAAKNGAGKDDGAHKPVKTARVTRVPLERTVTVMGALAAYDQATLRVKAPGRLLVISVDLGSVVRQGQLLAQIEPQDYQLRVQQSEAALAQARARLGLPPEGTDDRVDPEQTATVRQARAVLDEARANRERIAALFQQGVVAQSQLDTAESGYKVALSRYQDAMEEIHNRQAILAQRRSELALARQQLTDTAIYAPFEGVVQERLTSIGEYLAVGAPVVTIVRMDPLRLRAEVPEREARHVRAGQRVRVTVEGDPNAYTGRIVRLSPTIAAQNRILLVEAEVRNNGQLRPGSFARVDIVTEDQTPAVAVPTKAIATFAGIEKVIVVENGKAIERPVTTGRRNAVWTEITSGVNVGDIVVIEPDNLQTGQAVSIQER